MKQHPTSDIAILLAGGQSQRMGMPKALLPFGKKNTFLSTLHHTLTRAGLRVLVVTGAHAHEIARRHPEFEYLRNTKWEKGQFSSVKLGLKEALEKQCTRIWIHPIDAPFVSGRLLSRMKQNLLGFDAVVPVWRGTQGHPILLGKRAADRILSQRTHDNLRDALTTLNMARVMTKSRRILFNINTPNDYRDMVGPWPEHFEEFSAHDIQ